MTHRTLRKVSSSQASWDWVAVRALCLTVARGILESQAAAEDAAQEALVRAWRTCSRGEVRDPEAWIARIARNEALRIGSREGRLAALALEREPPGADDSAGDLEDRLTATALLAALPATDRQVLRLRYLEDLTQTEVADRLGIPEGTAKVRLHRARKRLQRQLVVNQLV